MTSREQNNFEGFKIVLKDTINKEEKKILNLGNTNKQVNDQELNVCIQRREQFFTFCTGSNVHIEKINEYKGNEKYIDDVQKNFYLTIDTLKKEALKIMAKNQKLWFSKLFDHNFDLLKALLRSLMIGETPNELLNIERIVQEVELIKHNQKKT